MQYLIVDAFTEASFAGNPAAVVWEDEAERLTDEGRLKIAAEFRHSETAFVSDAEPGAGRFDLRWFTPETEVYLCGHATLATAHALWRWGRTEEGRTIEFATRRSGMLVCRRIEGRIAMDFPAASVQPCDPPPGAREILGVQDVVECFNGPDAYLTLLVGNEEQVRSARPEFTALREWDDVGVIVTSASDRPGVDFVSRFFAPAVGIDEDPVTGSAHCTLTPLWAERLGKEAMIAEQLSRRGGRLFVRVAGGESARVEIAGEAVSVMEGRLLP